MTRLLGMLEITKLKIDKDIEIFKKIELEQRIYKENEINEFYKKLKEDLIQKIQMPAPPPRKKIKLNETNGGSSCKKIKRKVYIDKNGKEFIKYDKNIIIYLKY